jgi:hypothetical protein
MGGMGGGYSDAGANSNVITSGQSPATASTALASQVFSIPRSTWANTGKDVGAPFAASFTDLSVESLKTHVVSMPNLKVDAESLLVYRQTYHETKPLMSLEIINRMPFRLPAGPLTVFDELGNAGEAMLPMLVPDVKRMVNYAVDNEVVVRRDAEITTTSFESIEINEDKYGFIVSSKEVKLNAYQIESRSKFPKTLIVEHPKPAAEHTLVEHPWFDGETEDYVRYRVLIKEKETTSLKVTSERPLIAAFAYATFDPKEAQGWLSQPKTSAATKKRIEEILDLRRRLDVAKTRASDIATAVSLLKSEVERIRSILLSNLSVENRNRYDIKMGECEKRIAELEKEVKEVATVGLGLMKQLGSTETTVFQIDTFGITNRRRVLDADSDPFGGAP